MATGVVIYTDNDTSVSSGAKVKGAYGYLYVIDPWKSPVYSVLKGEDQGIPATATEAFSSQNASFVKVTVAQNANASADHLFGDVFIVFNSVDPSTDLNDPSVRRALTVQAGQGESYVWAFEPESCTSMHYLATNTNADLVLRWEWINGSP